MPRAFMLNMPEDTYVLGTRHAYTFPLRTNPEQRVAIDSAKTAWYMHRGWLPNPTALDRVNIVKKKNATKAVTWTVPSCAIYSSVVARNWKKEHADESCTCSKI